MPAGINTNTPGFKVTVRSHTVRVPTPSLDGEGYIFGVIEVRYFRIFTQTHQFLAVGGLSVADSIG
jgi:hypothetical protein